MSEENTKLSVKTRIAAIIIQGGKLLMLQGRGYKELWTPGGKIDQGENDIACLKRELMEELGVELVDAKFFKEYLTENFYSMPKHDLIERVYIVTTQGEPKPAAEIENVIWFSKEDFVNKKYPMITHTDLELIPDLIKGGIW